MSRHFFLDASSGESWEVVDPARWCLENAHEPILERARERLVTLDRSADPQRVIRLVTRRCKLNLIEIHPEQVIVHFWVRQADLRPFFKKHSLAKPGIEVFLIDRKREVITVQPGDAFLYGQRLPQVWPWEFYCRKWQNREIEESQDAQAAPCSWSSFVWEGIEPGLVSWTVLKVLWLRETAPLCLNCDRSTILVGFGRVQRSMFNWRHSVLRICPECRRRFEDSCPSDLGKWLVAHLDGALLPGFQRVWGKIVKWQPPCGQGSGICGGGVG